MRNLFVALTAALVVAVCQDGGRPPSGIQHPIDGRVPSLDAVAIAKDSLPIGLSMEATYAWSAAKRTLLAAKPILRLGSSEPGPTLFGYVLHADVGPDGNVIVLDAETQDIRVFAPNGDYVDGFGGRGDGPLELRRAERFHLFPDGRIAVPLGKNGPIKVFGRSEGRWTLLDVIDLQPTPSNSVCSMRDGRLFSSGYDREAGTIVNAFRAEGLSSFGHGYQYEQPFIRMALSEGLVECLEEPQLIAFAFNKLPIVRAYDASGSVRWTSMIVDDYLQLRIFEKRHPETGAVGYSEWSTREHDRLVEVHAIGSGEHLLLQYARVSWGRREVVPRSYLIDAATGIGAFLDKPDTLPPVLSVQPDGYIVLFEEPYPYVEVRRVLEEGEMSHDRDP